jgi:hypothetical protein
VGSRDRKTRRGAGTRRDGHAARVWLASWSGLGCVYVDVRPWTASCVASFAHAAASSCRGSLVREGLGKHAGRTGGTISAPGWDGRVVCACAEGKARVGVWRVKSW